MKKLKAIIVDDEESARDVLSNLITRFCLQIEIVAICSNVLDAVDLIKKMQPDVVFLDIEMPNYAGYEIVSFFEKINFEIIFVTAYDQYAIKAFEISAVDYLLKPIEIDRLKEAVQRLADKINLNQSYQHYKALKQNLKEDKLSKIVIMQHGNSIVLDIKTIITIEAQEAYSFIHTTSGNYLISKNLKHFETIFEQNKAFFRSHRSWIINTKHFISFSKTKLEIELTNNFTAKLSKHRKADFESLLIK